MPFLQVGAVVVSVSTDGAAETEPYRVGESLRAEEGNLRTSVRALKRAWRFTTGPLTLAQYNSLRTAVGTTGIAAVSGDAMPGSVNCEVLITDARYLADGLGFLLIASLSLSEA